MDKSYRFISDEEPTEEQLRGLMREVLEVVKHEAEIADKKFKELQLQQIKEAFEWMGQKQKKHEHN